MNNAELENQFFAYLVGITTKIETLSSYLSETDVFLSDEDRKIIRDVMNDLQKFNTVYYKPIHSTKFEGNWHDAIRAAKIIRANVNYTYDKVYLTKLN